MNKPEKIAIFTIDSLYSSIVLDGLVPALGSRVKVICLSKKYGNRRGGFLRQFKKNFRRSGHHFTSYLTLVFILYKLFLGLFNVLNKIFSADKKIRSIRRLAKMHNIEIIETDDANSEFVERKLHELGIDLIISSYFDQLIRVNIFSIPKFGTINFHPGKLPHFRGPFPSFWAMKAGEKELGATVHYVDDKFDTGDIILHKEIDIRGVKSVLGADYRIFKEAPRLLLEAVALIENGAPTQKRQAEGNYQSFPHSTHIKEFRQDQSLHLFTMREFFQYFI